LVGDGLSNAEIAHNLGISTKTVNTHKERIKEKLALRNAAELAQAGVRLVDGQALSRKSARALTVGTTW